MKNKRVNRIVPLRALSTWCLIIVCMLPSLSQAAGPWKGQVIDRETKKPIEEAVVLMVWYYHGGIMDQTRSYHDSEETITDAEGRFIISSRWYWNWFVFAESPDIFVFKGGYGQWQIQDYDKYTAERYSNLSHMERAAARLTGEGAVLGLPKLTTKKERLDMLNRVPHPQAEVQDKMLYMNVPRHRVPKLVEALNSELQLFGLVPLTVAPKEVKKK